ncbi:hypothetical protein H4R34_000566 [Dimargaris verticillata]|uniref:EF-hand domain-containing protein n=1 Tax=Dimargaris verticillata TaxID=2761393 RepID=A0A9W8BA55_9FUNG|nr:hypothetical protein H4R34_000566 [Dimargaris verticillata]
MSYRPPPGGAGPGAGGYSAPYGQAPPYTQGGGAGGAYGGSGQFTGSQQFGQGQQSQQGYGYGGRPPPNSGYGAPPPQGGYGAPYPPQRPPPQQPQGNPVGGTPDQNTLWSWFAAVDADRSGALTADELQRALMNGDWSPFNMETVRMMVNMFDRDNSGTITFDEFKGLWKYIEDWKQCFFKFDRDRSGSIDAQELTHALRTFGYNVPPSVINLLIRKFDIKAGNVKSKTGTGNVTFDNFIQACVTIRTLTESFQRFDTDQDGWVNINYEQFLTLVVNGR